METIQALMTALVAGASVALQAGAEETVREAYTHFKRYLLEKFGTVGSDVARLEQRPEQVSRQQVIAEELAAADAGADGELLQRAQALLQALAQQPSQVRGVILEDVKSAAIQLHDVVAQGTGNVTGVAIKGAEVSGAIEISGVRAGHGPANAPARRKLKILLLAANPLETARLRLDEEARAIDEALRKAEFRNLELQTHWAVRLADLQELLLRHQPDIVHFSGHGSRTQAILLQDAAGKPVAVQARSLRNLFQIFQPQIRCVVLNACYSDSQALALAEVVDCVVGMAEQIGDEASRHFAAAFYGALGYAQSVQRAFDLGCNRIDLSNLGEAHKPVLAARAGVDPATLFLYDPKV